ncbi:MAG: hypothetical protein V3W34_01060 [Phycisphaerae bacterium]
MTIMDVDPQVTSDVNIVQVDSDAPDNRDAILEIEQWASEKGFVRTNEYWLRQIVKNGRRLFRGICYRISNEEQTAMREDAKKIEETVQSMQPKQVSVDDEG